MIIEKLGTLSKYGDRHLHPIIIELIFLVLVVASSIYCTFKIIYLLNVGVPCSQDSIVKVEKLSHT